MVYKYMYKYSTETIRQRLREADLRPYIAAQYPPLTVVYHSTKLNFKSNS